MPRFPFSARDIEQSFRRRPQISPHTYPRGILIRCCCGLLDWFITTFTNIEDRLAYLTNEFVINHLTTYRDALVKIKALLLWFPPNPIPDNERVAFHFLNLAQDEVSREINFYEVASQNGKATIIQQTRRQRRTLHYLMQQILDC